MRIGRISGIEVRVHWSLAVVFLLIVTGLAGGLLPSWHPGWPRWLSFAIAVSAALLFIASILAHELSHAVVGRAAGVPIRKVTLFMLGGMAHMEDEPPSWRAELVMAVVGPVTSLVLGIGLTVAGVALAGPIETGPRSLEALARLGPLPTLLLWLGPINVIIGVFNLLPGFPLDGGRVFRAALWGATGDLERATRWAAASGRAVGWLLVGAGVAMAVGFHVPPFGTGLAGGLWLVLIGWFLHGAASQALARVQAREALRHVEVRALMETRLDRLSPGDRLGALAGRRVAGGQRAFPVEEGGRLVGLVCPRDVARADGEGWPGVAVEEVMTPVERLTTLSPRDDGARALRLLGHRGVHQLPVVEEGRLLGLVRREDLADWLRTHVPQRRAEGMA